MAASTDAATADVIGCRTAAAHLRNCCRAAGLRLRYLAAAVTLPFRCMLSVHVVAKFHSMALQNSVVCAVGLLV